MKRQRIFSLILSIVLSLTLLACNTDRTEENTDDTSNIDKPAINDNTGDVVTDDGTRVTFWNTDRDYTYTERDAYKEELQAAVDRLDKQIDMLEDRADNATGETKQNLEKRIDQLKEHRTNIENKINDWANITESEWDGFKSDVKTAWNDIQNSYNEVVRDITTDDEDKGM